jgi:hypothetical protein
LIGQNRRSTAKEVQRLSVLIEIPPQYLKTTEIAGKSRKRNRTLYYRLVARHFTPFRAPRPWLPYLHGVQEKRVGAVVTTTELASIGICFLSTSEALVRKIEETSKQLAELRHGKEVAELSVELFHGLFRAASEMAEEAGLKPRLVIGTTIQLLRAVDERTDSNSAPRHGAPQELEGTGNAGTRILQNAAAAPHKEPDLARARGHQAALGYIDFQTVRSSRFAHRRSHVREAAFDDDPQSGLRICLSVVHAQTFRGQLRCRRPGRWVSCAR